MSNSVWPHRRQPTRLLCPWDSPGKNTGVGCHFLLQCMKVKSESEVAQSCPTLSDPMDWSPPGSSIHGIFQARVLEWGAIAFSAKKTYRWPKGTWKDVQYCYILEKCKSKPQWGITSHQSERPSPKSIQIINAGEDVEKREPSYIVGGNVNWYNHYVE